MLLQFIINEKNALQFEMNIFILLCLNILRLRGRRMSGRVLKSLSTTFHMMNSSRYQFAFSIRLHLPVDRHPGSDLQGPAWWLERHIRPKISLSRTVRDNASHQEHKWGRRRRKGESLTFPSTHITLNFLFVWLEEFVPYLFAFALFHLISLIPL